MTTHPFYKHDAGYSSAIREDVRLTREEAIRSCWLFISSELELSREQNEAFERWYDQANMVEVHSLCKTAYVLDRFYGELAQDETL
jgi:hypothetical protein